MDPKFERYERVFLICIAVFMAFCMLFFVFTITVTLIQAPTMEKYKTNIKEKCYDRYGNIIDELTCYKKIHCSERLKSLNPKGCYKYVGGGK